MKHEKLVGKSFYHFEAELASPLSIGTSDSYYTDHDVLRRDDDSLYIPGSSIAGPIRSYMHNHHPEEKSFFEADSSMASPFSISDGTFESSSIVKTRDGIAIKGYENGVYFEKTTKDTAKYDYEVISSGAKFTFDIEITLRKNYHDYITYLPSSLSDAMKEIEEQVKEIAVLFDSYFLRLGYKKNRGFGCIRIVSLTGKQYYGDTLKDCLEENTEYPRINLSDVNISGKKDIAITCPVKILSGLCVRSYTEDINAEYDFTQLHQDGKAILPGTSLCGVLFHQMEKIQREISPSLDLSVLFGNSGERKESEAKTSKLMVDETYFENGHLLVSTRTSIDRFTGSALNQALFTQQIYIHGDGTLRFYIPREENLKPYVGLFLLALMDLAKGYCAVGGSTSIGYGILKGEKILIDGNEFNVNDNEYVDALARKE